MITYLLHTTSIWIVLFIVYKVLLSKEKYFILNRVYLLASLALGLLLPLLQFVNLTSKQVMPEVSAIYHQQVSYISELSISVRSSGVEAISIDWTAILFFLVSIGMAAMLIRNIIAGYKINDLYRQSEKLRHSEFTEVRTQKDHLPFSFFRYIFFSAFKLKEADRVAILNHEIHHVRAKHTWDVLFVEVIKVFFWWNPLVYLYKRAITENHEYAADHAAITQGSRKDYCALLLQSNMPGVNLDLGNPFFQTYIKKRIEMMYRKKSNRKSYLKFMLPVIAIVFMAFIINEDKFELEYRLNSDYIDLYAGEELLVPNEDYVIDREEGKIIIHNRKDTSTEGVKYCMFIIDEPRDASYFQEDHAKAKFTDFISVRLTEQGVLMMNNKEVAIEEVIQFTKDVESENKSKMKIRLSVDDNVTSAEVVNFLDKAIELNKIVVLDEDEDHGIPSISPLAPKSIIDKYKKGSGYGLRMHPVDKVEKFHKGIDLVAKIGTPIFATADGVVSKVKSNNSGYGVHVVLDHTDGYQSLYAHMESFTVSENDKVELGQQIGSVGNTGTSILPHLHYEVRIDGKAVDPIDFGVIANEDAKNIDSQKLIDGAKTLFGAGETLVAQKEKTEFKKLQEYNLNRSSNQAIVDDQIILGPEVNGDVIVKSNNVILVEDVDYKLNRATGIMRIINTYLLKNGNPIHVEFDSHDMDKIVYATKWSLKTDKKVASDMKYESNCKSNNDGVYFMASKMPTLEACNSGNVEDDSGCTRNELTVYIDENKVYPEAMVKKGFQGMLIYNLTVDENGNIESYKELLRKKRGDAYPELMAEGSRLLELVKSNKKLSPAQCNGKNVKSTMNFSFNFRLDDDQMKRVERRDASNTPNANQIATLTGISKGGLGYSYHTEMNVPYTVKITDPLGELIYNESFDYIYKAKREGVKVPNNVNGEFKIEVTQDGKTVSSNMNCTLF